MKNQENKAKPEHLRIILHFGMKFLLITFGWLLNFILNFEFDLLAILCKMNEVYFRFALQTIAGMVFIGNFIV